MIVGNWFKSQRGVCHRFVIKSILRKDKPKAKMRRSQAPSSSKKQESPRGRLESTSVVKQANCAQKFAVVYTEATKRKHKIYTSDGFLEVNGKRAKLMDSNGSSIGSSMLKVDIEENSILMIGGKDVQVANKIETTQLTDIKSFKKIETTQPEKITNDIQSSDSDGSISYSPPAIPNSCIGNIKKFTVVYADCSTRKNKVYTREGTLEIHEKRMKLKNSEGKSIGSAHLKANVNEDSKLIIGGKDVQVVEEIIETRSP